MRYQASIWRKKLFHTDPLIRIKATEQLGQSRDRTSLPLLHDVLSQDPDEIVRGYAAEAIGLIGERAALRQLERALEKEGSERARAQILFALCLLGKHQYVSGIKRLLRSRDYHTRCASIYILATLVHQRNWRETANTFRRLLKREPTVAVKSSLANNLAYLSHKFERKSRSSGRAFRGHETISRTQPT